MKKRAESTPTGRRLALTGKHRTEALVSLFDGMVWDDMLRRGVWKSADPVLNVLMTSWSQHNDLETSKTLHGVKRNERLVQKWGS